MLWISNHVTRITLHHESHTVTRGRTETSCARHDGLDSACSVVFGAVKP